MIKEIYDAQFYGATNEVQLRAYTGECDTHGLPVTKVVSISNDDLLKFINSRPAFSVEADEFKVGGYFNRATLHNREEAVREADRITGFRRGCPVRVVEVRKITVYETGKK